MYSSGCCSSDTSRAQSGSLRALGCAGAGLGLGWRMGQIQVLGPDWCHPLHTYHQAQSSEGREPGGQGRQCSWVPVCSSAKWGQQSLPPPYCRGCSRDLWGTGLRLAVLCRTVLALMLQSPHTELQQPLPALCPQKFFVSSPGSCT